MALCVGMLPSDFQRLYVLSQRLVALGSDFQMSVKTLSQDSWEPFALDRARTQLQHILDCGSEVDELLQESLQGESV